MNIEKSIEHLVEFMFKNMPPNMGTALGIEYISITKDEVVATMPVNENTIQPFGLLHGGASVALGETICSIGSWVNCADDNKTAVGIEINANHIRGVRNGLVKGVAKPVQRGRSIHVWEYSILNEDEKLVCAGRCTLSIVNRR